MKKDPILEEAKEYAKNAKYDKAILLLSNISPSFQWSVQDLLFKAQLIQLSDGAVYSLQDAEDAINEAIKLDSNSVEALIEMGFFKLRVQYAPKVAIEFFKKAKEIIDSCVKELDEGLKECKEL